MIYKCSVKSLNYTLSDYVTFTLKSVTKKLITFNGQKCTRGGNVAVYNYLKGSSLKGN